MTAGELARWFARYYRGRPQTRLQPHRGADERVAPLDVVGRHRPAVGHPLAQHAHRLHLHRLSRHVPDRKGRTSAKGRGNHAPVRILRRAVARLVQARRPPQSPRPARRPLPPRTTSSRPFTNYANQVCGGVELHVTNRGTFEPYRTGLWCVKVARDMNPEQFQVAHRNVRVRLRPAGHRSAGRQFDLPRARRKRRRHRRLDGHLGRAACASSPGGAAPSSCCIEIDAGDRRLPARLVNHDRQDFREIRKVLVGSWKIAKLLRLATAQIRKSVLEP